MYLNLDILCKDMMKLMIMQENGMWPKDPSNGFSPASVYSFPEIEIPKILVSGS